MVSMGTLVDSCKWPSFAEQVDHDMKAVRRVDTFAVVLMFGLEFRCCFAGLESVLCDGS